jgi:AraC-like DNA-binding protein
MIATSHVESELGCWAVTAYTPLDGDPLREVLQRAWLFNGTTAMPRERVFPDGTLEIVLQLNASYRPAGDDAAAPYPVLSAGGMRTAPLTIENDGRPVRVLGLVLRPPGAFALLRTPLHELTDRDVDLHDVIGRAAADFGERCTQASTDAHCMTASLDWIRGRLVRAPEPRAPVASALAQLEAGRGDLAIASLEALSGASRARFAAAFRDQVGVTPKRFARILRFRRALELLDASEAPLGAIAAQAGYYDQPHMNAEFRVHAGLTPQGYRRAQRFPNSTSLAEQIFQDAVAVPA